jgi:amino acid adenylation domain-containing protein
MSKPVLLPLTSYQLNVWFDQMLHPDLPLYNIGGYLRIRGPIVPAVLEMAFRQTVRKNDAFQIILHRGDLVPRQEFMENIPIEFPIIDLSQREDALQEALEWVRRDLLRPFDLFERPLFRYTLLRLSEDDYILSSCQHHIILDAYSVMLTLRCLTEQYNAIVNGEPGPDRYPRYRDFIDRDQNYTSSDRYHSDGRYWREKYRRIPEPMFQRSYSPCTKGNKILSTTVEFIPGPGLYEEMMTFARAHEVSLYHLALAGLYIYFSRTTSAGHFVFGQAIHSRSTPSLKRTMGQLANVNPLCLPFDDDINAEELFPLVRKELQATFRHYRYPLKEINRACGILEKGQSRLFDLAVSYERFEFLGHFNGSPTEAVTYRTGYEQNALAVSFKEYVEKDVRIDLIFNRSAFEDFEIKSFESCYRVILNQMIHNPDLPLHRLDILPEEQRRMFLLDGNPSLEEAGNNGCIHHLFEQQATLYPGSVALIQGRERMSYRQLNTTANSLAHALITSGVKPETLVGIFTERSMLMIAAVLAILKAGGAYVPLDPSHPKDRIAFMLRDAGVEFLLTTRDLLSRLPEHGAKPILLDREALAGPRENPVTGVTGKNCAYVIYTSGSTGVPKGVMVEHRGVCNLIESLITLFGIERNSRVLQFASLCFDASVSEIFMALCGGAELYLETRERLLPGQQLLNRLKEYSITHVTLPPSALNNMPYADLPGLKTLIAAGEQCPAGVYRKWSANRRFINGYGPTEATVCAAAAECRGDYQRLPIGRPIDNVSLYILDGRLRPVPLGVTGELFIGGLGLARGYLGRPELTEEKFIRNPFDDRPGSRLYRSGDLARYLQDGSVEYLGRTDHQVKIRGFRIELGEIEATLSKHPGITDCVVCVKESRTKQKRLVAYVVAEGDVAAEALQAYLALFLPEYMIPYSYVFLEKLPLSPNGKIDRNNLPEPEAKDRCSSHEGPKNRVEAKIVDIWSRFLDVDKIGANDGFFRLGGDSLLAARLVWEITREFGVDLPLAEVFERRTVRLLADYIEDKLKGRAPSYKWADAKGAPGEVPGVVGFHSSGTNRPFFCVNAGYGHVSSFGLLARHIPEQQPFYLLQPPAGLRLGTAGLKTLIEYYVDRLKTIQPRGPYRLGGYCAGGLIALEGARLLQKQGERIALLLLIETPFGYPMYQYLTFKLFDLLFPHKLLARRLLGFRLYTNIVGLLEGRGLGTQLEALRRYVPHEYRGKIHLFMGRHSSLRVLGARRMWEEVASEGIEVTYLPGNHASWLRPPNSRIFSKKLQLCISAIEGDREAP